MNREQIIVNRGRKIFFVFFAFFVVNSFVFAENEFSLQVAPRFVVPAGSEYFEPGFGVQAVVDWDFLQWPMPSGFGR
jgi:hypothetical protein